MEEQSAFEAPLDELRRKIEELESYPTGSGHDREIERLRKELRKQTRDVFRDLTAWQTVLVARHGERPYTLDYVERMLSDWVELHGDRCFSDDPSVVTGFAKLGSRSIAVVGHQKGRDTKERIRRNFGQPRPEGYRKALRVMNLAEKFGLPVVSFIDTPGAYPGIGAEERGQAEAIARNLIEMASLRVPIVVVITGEGGSGGALALGVGNRVLILEHAIYSVISPEGCAAILWKDQARRGEAAAAMRVTAPDLLRLGIVDEVIPEPLGGAHTDPAEMSNRLAAVLERELAALTDLAPSELVRLRRQRFLDLGVVVEQ
ncbi:MAG TPA: acetyl-CoA carboxylase carboxyltransferase subunit alpha [Thermoanaerobaculia bacterium]|nr:acetyl-CoA carboxylase carboxyltransferase subunit alpha [Thermoanaerobaculia bacterium]